MFANTSIDDLRTILKGTIILYDTEPVYVRDILNEEGLLVEMLSSRNRMEVAINNPLFDFEPFPLGFINTKNTVLYAQRHPRRQYRQGLSSDNCGMDLIRECRNDRGVIDSLRDFNSDTFGMLRNTIKGIYPTLNECEAAFNTGSELKAISRTFAISNNGEVYYKTKLAGALNFNTQSPQFFRNTEHLNWLWERRNESV